MCFRPPRCEPRLLAGGSGLARPTGMAAPERNSARKCQVRAGAILVALCQNRRAGPPIPLFGQPGQPVDADRVLLGPVLGQLLLGLVVDPVGQLAPLAPV